MAMEVTSMLFYLFAGLLMAFSLATVFSQNPLHSALYLAATMITLAFMFFNLKAYFIGGVQLIVYAGAVMVLFVMVLMLFDLKHEVAAFSRGMLANFLKIGTAGILLGFTAGLLRLTTGLFSNTQAFPTEGEAAAMSVKELSKLLFTKHVLAFEVLGFLLLVVAIGVVAIARMKGGTHGQHEHE